MRRYVVRCVVAVGLLGSGCSGGTSTQTATGAPSTSAVTGSTGGTGTTGTVDAPSTTAGGPTGTSTTTAPPKATGAAVPSPGCEAPVPAPGKVGEAEDVTIDVAGTPRTYRRFVPPAATQGTPVPLVLDFHGLGGRSGQEAIVTGWEARAEADRLVVITPQGAGVLPSWTATPADDNPDTAFVNALLDRTLAELCIDRTRVYANGVSNGGLESSILSCKLADRIAAVGLVAGIVVPEACTSAPPRPAIVFWGKLDCVLPYAGGLGPCLFRGKPGDTVPPADPERAVPPVDDAVRAWAGRNGCADEPVTSTVSEHVEKHTFTGCRDGAAVELYVVENGGHTWPGSKIAATRDKDPNSPAGITTMEIDATALIWAFFQRFQTAG